MCLPPLKSEILLPHYMNTSTGRSYTVTHPQRGIWYTEKIYPATSLYNIGGFVRIKGTIDFALLEETIHLFIKRNEGVRLAFFEEREEVKQYVKDYQRTKLDFVDFSRSRHPEKAFNGWVEKEAQKPFHLEENHLFYFALFRISESDNGY